MPHGFLDDVCSLARAVTSSVCFALTMVIVGGLTPASSAPAKPTKKICNTFSAELIFFGQETTRNDTVKRLDQAVIDWRSKPENEKAKEVKRVVTCDLAIPLLNEYHCKAEATLCK